MKALSALLLALFAQATLATEYSLPLDGQFTDLVQKGGFHDVRDVAISPKNFERAHQSTVRMGTDSTCSAVILSKDGYVATAAHCINACLETTFNSRPLIDLGWIKKTSVASPMEILSEQTQTSPSTKADWVIDALRIHEQRPSRLRCSTYLQASWTIWDYDLIDPEIVFLGRGMLAHDEKALTNISAAEFDQIKDLTEDVAILKYTRRSHKPNPDELPCLPVAKSKPLPQAPMWAIGFPVRGPGYTYDGYHKFVSLGQVRESIESDPILKTYAAEMSPRDAAIMWQQQKIIWNRDDLLLTSLDSAHGNSGGAMVNEQGELAGILTSITKSAPTYNAATTLGVSLPALQKDMVHWLGQEKVNEIFNCPASENTAATF